MLRVSRLVLFLMMWVSVTISCIKHPPHNPRVSVTPVQIKKVDREDDSSSADGQRGLHLPRLQVYGLATTHSPILQSEVSLPTTKPWHPWYNQGWGNIVSSQKSAIGGSITQCNNCIIPIWDLIMQACNSMSHDDMTLHANTNSLWQYVIWWHDITTC